jgi:iduronate 2-sulfatase
LASTPNKPFFLAVGIIKPHLPFGVPKKYLELYDGVSFPKNPYPTKPVGKSTWHPSNEIKQYDLWGKNLDTDAEFGLQLRKYYAACVSYADAQVGRILKKLKATGADKNTIVVLWGDHGWNLGEHAIWGKHNLFDTALRSPLIINFPGLKHGGTKSIGIVETLDIFPTLCDLTGVPNADFTEGQSLRPILENPHSPGHPAISYWKKAQTIRVPNFRLIILEDNFSELYSYESVEQEALNMADKNHSKVQELKQMLNDKLSTKF